MTGLQSLALLAVVFVLGLRILRIEQRLERLEKRTTAQQEKANEQR